MTAIWLNPIFPSPAYHGYQHGPADQLNPWFGNEAQLVSFLEAAHAAGLKVFVDFVAYGISRDAVYFQDAYANPGSVYDTWLNFDERGQHAVPGIDVHDLERRHGAADLVGPARSSPR